MLATALPATLRAGQPLPETRRRGWRLTAAGAAALAGPGRPGKPRALLARLAEGPLPADALDDADDRAAARTLERRGWAETIPLAGDAPAAVARNNFV